MRTSAKGRRNIWKSTQRARSKLLALLPPISLLLSLVLSEPLSVLLMAAGAALFHELGHMLAFALISRSTPTLGMDRFGLRLIPHAPLLPREQVLICLCGPLINIFFGVFSCQYLGRWGFLFGTMHLLFAFFNLLPFDGSDGGHILRLLLGRLLGTKRERQLAAFLSAAVLSFFFFLSLYVFYFTGNGLSGVFFAVFSFPWHLLESPDDSRENKRKNEETGENTSFRKKRRGKTSFFRKKSLKKSIFF